jgi:hypothetical protein
MKKVIKKIKALTVRRPATFLVPKSKELPRIVCSFCHCRKKNQKGLALERSATH